MAVDSKPTRPRYTSDAEEYGVDLSELSPYQRETWDRQELFLSHYAGRNTKTNTALGIGIHPKTVAYWEKSDLYSFRERLQHAHTFTVNLVEDRMLEIILNPEKPPNSPLWFFGWLRANNREKWGEAVATVDDTGRDVMRELQKIRQQYRNQRPQPSKEVDNVMPIETMRHQAQI